MGGAQEEKKTAGVRSPKVFYVSTKEASTTNFREYKEKEETVESGVKTDLDDEMIASSGKAVRDPKFMVYWLTTTKSSTSTSYTLTYSVLSVSCTPSGWPYSLCG